MNKVRRGARLFHFILVASLLTTALAAVHEPDVAAESVSRMPTKLQGHGVAMASVWTGAGAFLFGGGWIPSDAIWYYDWASESVMYAGDRLPAERYQTSAVWTGDSAYLFGGLGIPATLYRQKTMGGGTSASQSSFFDDIIRYDGEDRVAVELTARLPTGRRAAAAVWDGTYAYLIGGAEKAPRGDDDSVALDEILRFDPATESVQTMQARLPSGRWAAAVAWDGTYAYLFGGVDHKGRLYDDVLRYDPRTDHVQTMDARLPAPMAGTTAVWAGDRAYLFGGTTGTTMSDGILAYDPREDEVAVLPVVLPRGLYWMTGVWTGDAAYVFGGTDGTHEYGDIVRFDPRNQAPAAVLSWQASGLRASVDASGSVDVDGRIVSFAWDWGDGSTGAEGIRASHEYAEPGTYTVALAVRDEENAASSVAQRVTVALENQLPVAVMKAYGAGLTVATDASGSRDPDGQITAYTWDWGDGSPSTDGAVAAHSYAAGGTHRITLRVVDDDGAAAQTAQTIVAQAPPRASGNTTNATSTETFRLFVDGLAVLVDASDAVTPGLPPDAALWDWGDASPAERGLLARHEYASPGQKTIRLTIEGALNATPVERSIAVGLPARIVVTDISGDPGAVDVRTWTFVKALVTNQGQTAGAADVFTHVAGAPHNVTSVALEPGQSRILTFGVRPDRPGAVVVEAFVEGQEPLVVTLTAAGDPARASRAPALSPVTVLAAVGAIAGLGRIWRRR